MIVMEMGVLHAQGPKDMLLGKIVEGLSTDSLHDDSHQEISGVAIVVLFTGEEIQSLLPAQQLNGVLGSVEMVVGQCRDPGKCEVIT
jgi:hypothetical protein